MSSLYLTHPLPFEPRFLCLLLTVTTQKQTRVVLGLLAAFLSLHTIPYLQRTGKGGSSSRVTFSIFPGVKTQELSRALKAVESAKEKIRFQLLLKNTIGISSHFSHLSQHYCHFVCRHCALIVP